MTQLNPTLQDLRTHMVRDIDRQLHEFQGSTDRGSSSFHGTSARMGLSQRELETYSFSRAINEIRPGVDKHNNCLEWEVSRELAKRFEIPMGHIAIPMDVCEHRTMNLAIVYRLGAQRLTGLQNDVNLPRMTADPSVTWLAPGGSAVASDPAVGQILASPKIGVTITEVDEQMLKQSAADQIVSHSLASALAVGIDLSDEQIAFGTARNYEHPRHRVDFWRIAAVLSLGGRTADGRRCQCHSRSFEAWICGKPRDGGIDGLAATVLKYRYPVLDGLAS